MSKVWANTVSLAEKIVIVWYRELSNPYIVSMVSFSLAHFFIFVLSKAHEDST